MVCPPARSDGSPRVLTRGVGHTLEDSVPPHALLYLILPLLHVLILSFLILPLQVQGSGDVVLERMRLVLNQLAADVAARELHNRDPNDESDPDDDEDDYDVDGPLIPADFPGLFSDDVSCLMLL